MPAGLLPQPLRSPSVGMWNQRTQGHIRIRLQVMHLPVCRQPISVRPLRHRNPIGLLAPPNPLRYRTKILVKTLALRRLSNLFTAAQRVACQRGLVLHRRLVQIKGHMGFVLQLLMAVATCMPIPIRLTRSLPSWVRRVVMFLAIILFRFPLRVH